MSIFAATKAKLDKLDDPDPFLVAIALSLANLMDTEPASAVAKELRAVVDLLSTSNKTPGNTLDDELRRAEMVDASNA